MNALAVGRRARRPAPATSMRKTGRAAVVATTTGAGVATLPSTGVPVCAFGRAAAWQGSATHG
eukprot:11177452-Lingulodinium_polyedra.AAC.1